MPWINSVEILRLFALSVFLHHRQRRWAVVLRLFCQARAF